MGIARIIWDLDDDPEGNLQHILEHDITREEVEEILERWSNVDFLSRSSDNRITFGWTSTDRYLAVIWELVEEDPRAIRPITAYSVPPPMGRRHERS